MSDLKLDIWWVMTEFIIPPDGYDLTGPTQKERIQEWQKIAKQLITEVRRLREELDNCDEEEKPLD